MLTVNVDTVRLLLHVLAATVLLGGQLTLAALVPALRRMGPDVPGAAGAAIQSGCLAGLRRARAHCIWNVLAVSHMSASYRTTLIAEGRRGRSLRYHCDLAHSIEAPGRSGHMGRFDWADRARGPVPWRRPGRLARASALRSVMCSTTLRSTSMSRMSI